MPSPDTRIATLEEYAALRGLDAAKLARTLTRHGALPEAVADPAGEAQYRVADLDAARGYAPGWVTLEEYAAKRGLALSTVRSGWRARYREVWPAPVSKRGRADVFEEAALDRVRRVAAGLPPDAEGSPDDLLTRAQVAEYLGVAEETVREAVWSGRLPRGVDVGDGVVRWRRGAVEEARVGDPQPGVDI